MSSSIPGKQSEFGSPDHLKTVSVEESKGNPSSVSMKSGDISSSEKASRRDEVLNGLKLIQKPKNIFHTTEVIDLKFHIPTHYTLKKLLGRGSYGVVCSGSNEKTGE